MNITDFVDCSEIIKQEIQQDFESNDEINPLFNHSNSEDRDITMRNCETMKFDNEDVIEDDNVNVKCNEFCGENVSLPDKVTASNVQQTSRGGRIIKDRNILDTTSFKSKTKRKQIFRCDFCKIG